MGVENTNSVCVFFTLLLFLLKTGGSAFAQTHEPDSTVPLHDHTIDSVMAFSPEFMPVYKAKIQGVCFNPLVYAPIDTSMFHTSEYDPIYSVGNMYQTLGICSQAHKNMVYNYDRDFGFSIINLPYPLYFKKMKDIDYYDVETSFTEIGYHYGFTKENTILATHAQKIKQFNYKFNLHGYRNDGYFLHQACNMYTMDIVAHYEVPNGIYGVILTYILNHGKYAENGGLSDYHLFTDREERTEHETTLSAFGVELVNATSLVNTHDAMLQQYINLKDKKGRYWGTFTHAFEFKKLKSIFDDNELNDAFYLGRYYLNTDTTNDTIRYFNVTNTLQWSNYQPLQRQSDAKYSFRIAGGIRHEHIHAAMPFYKGNSFTLFARTNIRLFSFLDIYGSFAYSFNGYNKNDAFAQLSYTFTINRQHRHFVGVSTDFYRISPDLIFSYYTGNNNVWYFDWKKQNNFKLCSFWSIFDYKIGFNYFLMGRYLYFNDQYQPELVEKPVSIIQLTLFAPLKIKNFRLETSMALQHSSSTAIAVPLFTGKLYAAYCFRIFKNRLRIHVGGNLMYNTLYYADGYNPILHQFYRQEKVKTGNYLYFDANITFQVSRIAFYVRGGNLLEGIFGYRYFTTPNYPMEGRRFHVGITWKFYD